MNVHFIEKFLIKLVDLFLRVLVVKRKGFSAGKDLKLMGKPIVQIANNAKICLGTNVTLNSRNYGYHASMHSPVKLMADRSGAVISIGNNTRINGACIHACAKIEIGKNCLIAANVQIIDSNGHEACFDNPASRINTSSDARPVFIEDNVWIGIGAVILPGSRIGKGSIIGANTVVTKDVPAMVVFAGNPGRIVKKASP
jgi:acetyltransferase-like isoleucine patch superfamily enzyme